MGAAMGAWMPTLVAAHDAVRYGGGAEAARLVGTAAAQVDAELPRRLAAPSCRAAVRASVRASTLHERCEQAATWWVPAFHTTALTRREQHVALLAAAGHPDAAIAAKLGISPRTVQTHLLRTYSKLNVTGRRDLPAALTEQ